ncbi:MAG: hypothetical protein R3F60_14850 [bacterium]
MRLALALALALPACGGAQLDTRVALAAAVECTRAAATRDDAARCIDALAELADDALGAVGEKK